MERGPCWPDLANLLSQNHSFSHIFPSLLLALRMMKRISAAMAAVSAQPHSANYTTKYSQRGLGTSCQPCLKSRKHVVSHFEMSLELKVMKFRCSFIIRYLISKILILITPDSFPCYSIISLLCNWMSSYIQNYKITHVLREAVCLPRLVTRTRDEFM